MRKALLGAISTEAIYALHNYSEEPDKPLPEPIKTNDCPMCGRKFKTFDGRTKHLVEYHSEVMAR